MASFYASRGAINRGSMSTQPENFPTRQEYSAIGRKAQYKSVYWNGRMHAMAGASFLHSVIQATSFSGCARVR